MYDNLQQQIEDEFEEAGQLGKEWLDSSQVQVYQRSTQPVSTLTSAEYRRQYRRNHPEGRKAEKARYRKKHAAKIAAYKRAWRKKKT